MIRTVLHYLHGRFIHAMLKTQSQGLVPVRCRLLCILRKQTQKTQESTSGTLSLGYLDSQFNWVTSWCHAAPRWQRWRSLNIRPLYSVRELLGLPLTPNAKTCNDAVQSQWCEDRKPVLSKRKCSKNLIQLFLYIITWSLTSRRGNHMLLWLRLNKYI